MQVTKEQIEAEIAKLEADEGNRDFEIAAHALLWVLGDREDAPSAYFEA